MKGKKLIGCLMLLVVTGLVIWRIYAVNQDIPLAEKMYYHLGDEVPFEQDVLVSGGMQGYSIKVNAVEVMDLDRFLEKYDGNIDDIADPPQKVYDLNVTVTNENNTDGGIILYEFKQQNKAAISSFNLDCYKIANAEKNYENAGIAVRPGTSVTFQLPFSMYRHLFNTRTWENLENYPMYLTVTLYPHKKMIWINE